MTYFFSDLHGRLDPFLAMLEKISFSNEDTLYIMGDLLDRGEKPIPLLRFVMSHPDNMKLLLGNHELYALLLLKLFLLEIDGENYNQYVSPEVHDLLQEWGYNGGGTTIEDFVLLSSPEQREILHYLSTLPYRLTLNHGGKNILLAHTHMPVLYPPYPQDYGVNLKGTQRIDYKKDYFPHTLWVSGHTPTGGEVFHNDYHLVLDGGMEVLHCYCLEQEKIYTI